MDGASLTESAMGGEVGILMDRIVVLRSTRGLHIGVIGCAEATPDLVFDRRGQLKPPDQDFNGPKGDLDPPNFPN